MMALGLLGPFLYSKLFCFDEIAFKNISGKIPKYQEILIFLQKPLYSSEKPADTT